MKILHLYSDWKWTGPAEPVLQMCRVLEDLGHDVLLAHCRDAFEVDESISKQVVKYGITATERFALDRHIPPFRTLGDLWGLPRFMASEQFDIVHMHLCHDHSFGGVCAKLLGRRRPTLIRTLHRRDVLKDSLGYNLQLRRLTDGFLTFTPGFRQTFIERFALPPECVGIQPMTVDLERFRPEREFRDMRSEFGIAPDAPVIGIVGRFQKYRKMDVFLEAAKQVISEAPETRFLVIGRSSQIQDTVVRPCQELGIEKEVILTGYRTEDYDDVIACLDVFSLLMPGFDGTARAVREAMALAKPCVVSDFGMLPEIVKHETCGLNAAMRPDALAQAWLRMVRSPGERKAMGEAARKDAEARFGMDQVGTCLVDFYRHMLDQRGKPGG